MIDAGDKVIVQKQHKKARLRVEREKEELRALLSQPGNRAVMWRILSKCGVFRDNPFPHSHGEMARHEGQRSVGLWLLQEIEVADPRAYTVMRNEATLPMEKDDD